MVQSWANVLHPEPGGPPLLWWNLGDHSYNSSCSWCHSDNVSVCALPVQLSHSFGESPITCKDYLHFSSQLRQITFTWWNTKNVSSTLTIQLSVYHTHVKVRAISNVPFLLSCKLCILYSLLLIGHPSVWSCWFQQTALGISFFLCVSCLLAKTVVVLVAFRSTGAGDVVKCFGTDQQRGSVCLFTSIQVSILMEQSSWNSTTTCRLTSQIPPWSEDARL